MRKNTGAGGLPPVPALDLGELVSKTTEIGNQPVRRICEVPDQEELSRIDPDEGEFQGCG